MPPAELSADQLAAEGFVAPSAVDIDPPSIAIVIAARNEAAELPAALEALSPFSREGDRIIVVDDGSSDTTGQIARQAGAELMETTIGRRGRGYAFEIGVGSAFGERSTSVNAPNEPDASSRDGRRTRDEQRADLVVMLHADTRLSPHARREIVAAYQLDGPLLRAYFPQRIRGAGRWIRLLERGNAFRARRLGLVYGDQAIVIGRAALRMAGGFPDRRHLEDLELSLRLRRLPGRWRCLAPAHVSIGVRHWGNAVAPAILLRTLANWVRVFCYIFGRFVTGCVRWTLGIGRHDRAGAPQR